MCGPSAAHGPLSPLGLGLPVREVGTPPSSLEGCRQTHVTWFWRSGRTSSSCVGKSPLQGSR